MPTTKATRVYRRLTQSEFEAAASRVRMSDDMRYAAFAYMVLENTFDKISKATHINDRSIQRKVREIWNAHNSAPENELPEGWGRRVIALPLEQLELVEKRSQELLQRERERKAMLNKDNK